MTDWREREIIWAAGIIQGEGCIRLYPRKPNGRIPRISVGQGYPDMWMLERLQYLWGGSVLSNGPRHNPKWAPLLKWEVSCRLALRACTELVTCGYFHGPKYVKALAVINYYKDKDETSNHINTDSVI